MSPARPVDTRPWVPPPGYIPSVAARASSPPLRASSPPTRAVTPPPVAAAEFDALPPASPVSSIGSSDYEGEQVKRKRGRGKKTRGRKRKCAFIDDEAGASDEGDDGGDDDDDCAGSEFDDFIDDSEYTGEY